MIQSITDPVSWAFTLLVIGVAGSCVRLDLSLFQRVDPGVWDDLLDGVQDGYVLLDADGRITEANAQAGDLLSTSGELTGSSLTEQRPALAELLDGTGPDEQVEDEVVVGTRPDHLHLMVACVGLPGEDPDRDRLVTVRDVTDRRALERRYRAFTENGTDLVVITDERGTIRFASPSFETVLGYDPATIEGQNLTEDVHEESEEALEAAIEAMLDKPDNRHRFEYAVTDTDGNWHDFEGIGRNLLDDDIVGGLVITSRDVTDRKRQERDLRRQNEYLEEFTGVISHDLRNPLQVARGRTEHLSTEIDDETHLPAIQRSLLRIEELIDNLLELARQGQRVGETSPVSIETVAREAWACVETDAQTLTVNGDCTIQADETRLQQLFENLFRNVVDHAGPDATVTVGPIEPMHTGTRVEAEQPSGFYVADDGPGIPAEIADDLFDSGVTTETNGTGFGLAIVDRIAEAHGWEVRAVPSRTGGARFEITEAPSDETRRG